MADSGVFNLTEMLTSEIFSEYQKEIEDIFKTQNITTNAELILQLCRLVTNKIDIYVHSQYIKAAGRKLTLYGNKSDNKGTEEEAEIMIYGARLIYVLRSFLTEQDIDYHFATLTKDRNYKASAFVSQEQVLKSLTKVKKNAIGVSTKIQNDLIQKNKKDYLTELKRENLWDRVLELAEPSYQGTNTKKVDVRKPNSKKAHWAYQSQKEDFRVYIAYAGSKERIYYDREGNSTPSSLTLFNRGNLWEWYNSILYGESEEAYTISHQAIKNGSLEYIMKTQDYIRGTKQGDFQDVYRRWIQSKYGNEKIISYNNIREVIYKLEKSLEMYIAENKNGPKELLSILEEHFFPESASIGNKFANEIANELLNKLNLTI